MSAWITLDRLDRFLRSGGSKPQPEWLDAFAEFGPVLVDHYGMTLEQWRLWFAQVAHETSGLSLSDMTESFRYSSSRMVQVFSYRLRKASNERAEFRGMTIDAIARQLEGRPYDLADVVYGGREGTPIGEGHRYIGRGPMQTTHRNNYAAVYKEISTQPGGEACPNLITDPEALTTPEWGVRAAFAEWKIKRLALYDQIDEVSSVVNAGSPGRISIVNGVDSRRRWYARARGVWPEPETELMADASIGNIDRGNRGERVYWLQGRLSQLGYHTGKIDGVFGQLTEDAVVLFQRANGLPITGRVTSADLDVLTVDAKRELGERETANPAQVQTPYTGAAKAEKADAAIVSGVVLTPVLADILTWFEQTRPLVDWLIGDVTRMTYFAALAVLVVAWRLLARAGWLTSKSADDVKTGAYMGADVK